MISAKQDFIAKLVKLGYKKLTPVQEKAIPIILEGNNTLVISPTGSGKTEAAILPIFYKIYLERPNRISTIYITPLRALNRDLESRLKYIAKEFDIKVSVRHGDSKERERKEVLSDPPDVLITTPETLLYLIVNDKYLKLFKNIKWIIIDEIQELIDEKRGIELSVVLEILKRNSNNTIQLIGLSATLGNIEAAKRFLDPLGNVKVVKINIHKSIQIDIKIPRVKKEHIERSVGLDPRLIARLDELARIIREYKPVLIFTNTRDTAEFLAAQLFMQYNLNIFSHHGSLSREMRTDIEKKFKEGTLDGIVATSSLELGIDIGLIKLVVQYMSPKQVTRILQRIGRSGHSLDKISKGIIIPSTDIFDILESLAIKELAYNGYIEDQPIEFKPYDIIAHLVAGLSLNREWKIEELYDIFKNIYYYKDLTMEEFLKIIYYLNDIKIIKISENYIKPYARTIKYYYNTNMIPDSSKHFIVINFINNNKIGVLEENFVASLDEDQIFVLGGKLWRVVSIEEGKVYVEPASLNTGILPSWFGESIPVEKEVAMKVYEYLEKIANGDSIPLDDEEALKTLREIVHEHKRRGYPLPTRNKIVIEFSKDLIIIHSPFGTRGNNTLGALFSYLLSRGDRNKITYQYDAYHIALASFMPISKESIIKVLEIIKQIKIEDIIIMIKNSILQTPKYKWKLVVEAKRFGAIDPNADLTTLLSVIKSFNDTLVGEEAIREMLVKDYDISVIEKIREFIVEVIEVPSPSPLANQFLSKILYQGKSDEDLPLLLEIFKRKILSKEIKMICIICGWNNNFKVNDVPNECKKCGSVFLAITNIDDLDAVNIIMKSLRGQKLNKVERKRLDELKHTADLFAQYKKYAAIGLVTNGVGPHNFPKIASKISEGIEKFFEALLQEERKFLKAKKYILNK
jgi:ATP-dependent Lhr-like helicase